MPPRLSVLALRIFKCREHGSRSREPHSKSRQTDSMPRRSTITQEPNEPPLQSHRWARRSHCHRLAPKPLATFHLQNAACDPAQREHSRRNGKIRPWWRPKFLSASTCRAKQDLDFDDSSRGQEIYRKCKPPPRHSPSMQFRSIFEPSTHCRPRRPTRR